MKFAGKFRLLGAYNPYRAELDRKWTAFWRSPRETARGPKVQGTAVKQFQISQAKGQKVRK